MSDEVLDLKLDRPEIKEFLLNGNSTNNVLAFFSNYVYQ